MEKRKRQTYLSQIYSVLCVIIILCQGKSPLPCLDKPQLRPSFCTSCCLVYDHPCLLSENPQIIVLPPTTPAQTQLTLQVVI